MIRIDPEEVARNLAHNKLEGDIHRDFEIITNGGSIGQEEMDELLYIRHENGDISYRKKIQEDFNEHYDLYLKILKKNQL